jgi:hypothetical protein
MPSRHLVTELAADVVLLKTTEGMRGTWKVSFRSARCDTFKIGIR